jgi:FkbM family methyltransferase
MLNKPEYFTYCWLTSKIGKIPRYQDCHLKVNGFDLLIPDAMSFLFSYQEIFVERIYEFKAETSAPKILDLGANIGLSILFFKSLYPQAKITAFEADPKIFSYLKKNVNGNGCNDVDLVNKAVWHEKTTLDFISEGADAGYADSGYIAATSKKNLEVKKLEAVDIAEVLRNREFDFLKMDIEGAEEFVLPRCKDLLSNIKFIFIEYHSKVNSKQCLDKILNILSNSGFRVHIRNVMESPSPFVDLKIHAEFDLQLNIFGWR